MSGTIDLLERAQGATDLQVRIQKGDVTVIGGEDKEWSLEWSSDADIEPTVSRSGDRLRVEQPSGGFFRQHRLDVRITMPGNVKEVDVGTGHGRLDVEGVAGQAKLNSGHGGVSIRSAGGEAEVNTGHGGVTIERFKGHLTANSGHGRLRIEKLEGDAELRTGHGHVEIVECTGTLRVTTGHGGLTALAVGGELQMRSGHGRIEIGGPRDLSLDAQTGMGGVSIDGGSLRALRLRVGKGELRSSAALAPGKYDLQVDHGSVEIQLPADARARVDLQTSFGQIRSDFPLVQVGRSGPMGFGGLRMVGSIGEGEPQIELNMRSGKGSLAIRRAGSTAREAFTAAAGPGVGAGPVGVGAEGWSRPWRGPTMDVESRISSEISAVIDAAVGAAEVAAEAAGEIAQAAAGEAAARAAEVAGEMATRFAPTRWEAPESPTSGRPPAPPLTPSVETAPIRSSQTPMVSAQHPVQRAPSDEGDPVVAILESLARGEITPREAEEMLAASRR